MGSHVVENTGFAVGNPPVDSGNQDEDRYAGNTAFGGQTVDSGNQDEDRSSRPAPVYEAPEPLELYPGYKPTTHGPEDENS